MGLLALSHGAAGQLLIAARPAAVRSQPPVWLGALLHRHRFEMLRLQAPASCELQADPACLCACKVLTGAILGSSSVVPACRSNTGRCWAWLRTAACTWRSTRKLAPSCIQMHVSNASRSSITTSPLLSLSFHCSMRDGHATWHSSKAGFSSGQGAGKVQGVKCALGWLQHALSCFCLLQLPSGPSLQPIIDQASPTG